MKQKNMVLMVVAVGCGLVAAFLTSQMSGKSAQVEQVDVIVAAKDLAVGTQITRDDLPKLIKRKKMPKDGLPPLFVQDENELVDKRLSRPIRAEETFNPGDLTKGGVVTIPAGMDMHTLQLSAPQAVAGFVGPGSRVDVLVCVRLGSTIRAMPLLVNMLVLAVDQNTAYSQSGTFPTLNSVSFAVERKQALVIELAKARGCTVSLLLRNPESKIQDDKYKIDEVIKLLSDDQNRSDVNNPKASRTEGGPDEEIAPKVAKAETPAKVEVPPVPAAPKTVKVPAATEDIPAGTAVTKDLIAEKFQDIELPAETAKHAFIDLNEVLGKVFRTGLGKGQWVTESLVGKAPLKVAPQEEFQAPKPAPADPKAPAVVQAPKVEKPKRRTTDTTITTASGSRTYRYEEVKPGEWRLIGEVTDGGVTRTPDKVD
jgi:Flp pilus assembly protein CpaB